MSDYFRVWHDKQPEQHGEDVLAGSAEIAAQDHAAGRLSARTLLSVGDEAIEYDVNVRDPEGNVTRWRVTAEWSIRARSQRIETSATAASPSTGETAGKGESRQPAPIGAPKEQP